MFIAPYIVLVAILMVSRIPTFSGKNMGPRVRRDLVLPILGCAVLGFVFLISFPWETLMLFAIIYILMIPLSIRSYRAHKAKDAKL